MRHIVIGDKDTSAEDKLIKNSFEDEDDETDGYFSGYAHFGIHHDMIAVIVVLLILQMKST